MPLISKEKLTYLKNRHGLSNAKIAELTGLQVSTVDKIFSGANKNPTLITLEKITKLFGCTVSDLIEEDDDEENDSENYYREKETQKLAQEIYENKQLRILFDASKNLTPEDIEAVIAIAKRIQATRQ